MSSQLKLRLRCPNGKTVQLDVEPATTLGLLEYIVEHQLQQSKETFLLLGGFPPKVLGSDVNVSDGVSAEEMTLQELGVVSGDTITVQKAVAGSGNGTSAVVSVDSNNSSMGSADGREGASRMAKQLSTDMKKGHTDGRYIPPTESRSGHFVRRVVPSDNSCLFHAAAFVLKDKSRSDGPSLRKEIAEVVMAHPQKFTAALLGRPTVEYCAWIMQPTSWGGAIELLVLSFVHQTEIVAMDVEAKGRLEVFGRGEGYTTRVFLLYTGQHYDAMALAKFPGAGESGDQVMFSAKDERMLSEAQSFVHTFKP